MSAPTAVRLLLAVIVLAVTAEATSKCEPGLLTKWRLLDRLLQCRYRCAWTMSSHVDEDDGTACILDVLWSGVCYKGVCVARLPVQSKPATETPRTKTAVTTGRGTWLRTTPGNFITTTRKTYTTTTRPAHASTYSTWKDQSFGSTSGVPKDTVIWSLTTNGYNAFTASQRPMVTVKDETQKVPTPDTAHKQSFFPTEKQSIITTQSTPSFSTPTAQDFVSTPGVLRDTVVRTDLTTDYDGFTASEHSVVTVKDKAREVLTTDTAHKKSSFPTEKQPIITTQSTPSFSTPTALDFESTPGVPSDTALWTDLTTDYEGLTASEHPVVTVKDETRKVSTPHTAHKQSFFPTEKQHITTTQSTPSFSTPTGQDFVSTPGAPRDTLVWTDLTTASEHPVVTVKDEAREVFTTDTAHKRSSFSTKKQPIITTQSTPSFSTPKTQDFESTPGVPRDTELWTDLTTDYEGLTATEHPVVTVKDETREVLTPDTAHKQSFFPTEKQHIITTQSTPSLTAPTTHQFEYTSGAPRDTVMWSDTTAGYNGFSASMQPERSTKDQVQQPSSSYAVPKEDPLHTFAYREFEFKFK